MPICCLTCHVSTRHLQVERVLEKYVARQGKAPEYLVKWLGLEYSDSTWETAAEVNRDGKGRVSYSSIATRVWPIPVL